MTDAVLDSSPATVSPASRARWRMTRGDIATYVLNIIIAIAFLLPWVLAITISLLPDTALKTYPPTIFAWPFDLSSYSDLLTVDDGRFLGYLRTSALVAGCTAISVVLVSGITALGVSALGWSRRTAVLVAVVSSAFIFSAFHYIPPYGDRLELASFTFRFLSGLAFSALYVVRGFGITAWTHALYDAFLLLF